MKSQTYRKKQSAHALLSVLMVALVGGLLVAGISQPLFWAVGLLLALVGYLFSSLTVIVDDQAVRWHFGPGFWRKSIALDEISGVRSVRNKWWYGWGIRITPHGWLYCVSGLEAVELQTADGKTLRIGTAEPERLRLAIEAATKSR